MRGSFVRQAGRVEIMKIHGAPITKKGDIDYESVVKLADGFNAADLRNVCTEAGMFAIRAERDYVIEEDFMKAVRRCRRHNMQMCRVQCCIRPSVAKSCAPRCAVLACRCGRWRRTRSSRASLNTLRFDEPTEAGQ